MEGPDEKKNCLQRFCTAKKQQNTYGLPTILKKLKAFFLQIVKNGSTKQTLQ